MDLLNIKRRLCAILGLVLTRKFSKQKGRKREGWDERVDGYLFGDVESVAITETKYIPGDAPNSTIIEIERDEFYKFNLKGNVSEVTCGWQGRLLRVYKYDNYDKLIDASYYDSEGSLHSRSQYKYDIRGKMIEKNDGYSNSVRTNYFYKYDPYGNLIEKDGTWCYNYGSRTDKDLYKYDSYGNMIEIAGCTSDGAIFKQVVFEYDWRGNLIERINYRGGYVASKTIYKYDKQGNRIEEASYNADGSLCSKCVSKYDKQGNMLEAAWFNSNGSLIEKVVWKYDSYGNRVECDRYDGEQVRPTSREVREILYRK